MYLLPLVAEQNTAQRGAGSLPTGDGNEDLYSPCV